ncbi:NAD(P)/FAD-dependent oxidoreductase [Brevibacillus dissolubilis]|uniref:NAD(P)/FAD-dependent oxidoreductase n=1 Tax=Brevibacillus dissolubilis TaxID=1844116 RepID=UPI00111762F5|nr:NAD(P)/FAD-dependent oxidoreductase [Brevibacillus dissolubilis]
MEHVQVLIAGAGIAGISAAIWCRRLGLQAILIEQEPHIGGQLKTIKNTIWDFPPHLYANGLELLDELNQHQVLGELDIRLSERLISIDPVSHLVQTDKTLYQADYLIAATGVRANTLTVLEGASFVLAPWFSTTSQGELLAGRRVLVVGGGDRAVESAYNISPYAEHIWLAVRGDKLRARPEWVERLDTVPNVTVLYETEVTGYIEEDQLRTAVQLLESASEQCAGETALSDDQAAPSNDHAALSANAPSSHSGVSSLLPDPQATQTGVFLEIKGQQMPLFLPVDRVMPRIGIRGNSDVMEQLKQYGEGFIQSDEYQATSCGWIYAIGDLTNGSVYASLSLASGQAMKAVKHISLQLNK